MTVWDKLYVHRIINYYYGQHKISEKFVVSVKNKLDWAFGGIWQCVLVQTIPWYTSTSPIKEFEFILGNMRMKCILPKMYNPQEMTPDAPDISYDLA